MLTYRRESRPNPGFSLVELICVLGIVSVLVAITIPSIQSLLESSNLNEGGQMLTSQIKAARQLAAAKNKVVEVRLIQLDGAGLGYRGIQLWGANPGAAGQAAPLGTVVALPRSVTISQDTTKLSPLLSGALNNTMPTSAGVVSGDPYYSFFIAPSGLVELNESKPGTVVELATPGTSMASSMAGLYLSIVPIRYAQSTSPPHNYVTVQLNPNTGTELVFRP
jgi:uncharacterized protein (TIGR02596 family)